MRIPPRQSTSHFRTAPGPWLTAALFLASAPIGTLPAQAQTETELDIRTYAGLTITGAVGTVYAVEYVTDLSQTNTPEAWRCLELLQLPTNPCLWTDRSTPLAAKRFYRVVAAEAPANMVFIPPGTFRMGSPANEADRSDWEGPQTAVTIRQGFWMGIHEVTQGDYDSIMGNNPSYFQPPWVTTDTNRPVESVSWHDAVAYCAALTEQERTAGRIGASAAYRLPTEAEWEYACRAWTSTRFSHGEDPSYSQLAGYAWHSNHGPYAPQPVGQLTPNPWGLYDMHGNVWEWCQDWWGDYAGGIAVDPQGPDTGSNRVFRGGSWEAEARACRSACREAYLPDFRYRGLGFRVVLAPGSRGAQDR